jgi:tetratricopeptide (TPR) repeat protein
MSARDRSLLDALGPWLERGPAGTVEMAGSLDAIVAAHPDDGEALLYTAYAHVLLAEHERAIAVARQALAADPSSAMAWELLIISLGATGHGDEARAAIDTCLKAAPASVMCLELRGGGESAAGRCDALEETAREMVSRDPEEAQAYTMLLCAEFSLDRPEGTLREVIDQRAARFEPKTGVRVATQDLLRLHAAVGDFAAVEKDYTAVESLLGNVPSASEHAAGGGVLLDALAEEGKTAERARFARAYLDRLSGWIPNSEADTERDILPRLVAAAQEGGAMSGDVRAAKRAAWLEAWRAKPAPPSPCALWITAYAGPAETQDDAREALAALPDRDACAAAPDGALWLGKVLLLSGDAAGARPWLEKPHVCSAHDAPLLRTRTMDWLGRAREATGDTPGACEAYGRVVTRWGTATPRSVTADHARGRMRALACPSR